MCVTVQMWPCRWHHHCNMKILLTTRRLLPLIIAVLMTDNIYAAENNHQELIDDMTVLLDQAEKDRSANTRFLKQARDLLRSYEWPWQTSLLEETFRDGDYTRSPAWVVDSGKFQVVRGQGLRSQTSTQSTAPTTVTQGQPRDAVSQILDILRQGTAGNQTQQAAPAATRTVPAAIHTVVSITNSFLIEIDVSSLVNSADSGFSIGPYQGERRDTGYQLVYRGGTRPALELHRFTAGRNAIVEVREDITLLDDTIHTLIWLRRNDGEMSVLLDGSEMFTTSDRGLRDTFSGFMLVDETGEFSFSRVSIHGEGK